jgi:hypothetical protein
MEEITSINMALIGRIMHIFVPRAALSLSTKLLKVEIFLVQNLVAEKYGGQNCTSIEQEH